MASAAQPVAPSHTTGTPSTPSSTTSPRKARPSYSVFPPIPAPLQRLFDLVPLVTYPANSLPGEVDAEAVVEKQESSEASAEDKRVEDKKVEDNTAEDNKDTLFVFIDPRDAPAGRPSFNPTCLKWQAYLRFQGVPVQLAPSTNHAAPAGALPFLLPGRGGRQQGPGQKQQQQQQKRGRPVPAHDLEAYAQKKKKNEKKRAVVQEEKGEGGETSSPPVHPRAPAYQSLLDGSIRRAWLHAVYLDERGGEKGGENATSIASRLYAHSASSSSVVRSALGHQLRAAAAAEVFPGGPQTNTPGETARIYRDAAAAWAALATLLEEEVGAKDEKETTEGAHEDQKEQDNNDSAPPSLSSPSIFFFGNAEPTLFDAAVFAYTHLLLEDDGDNGQDRRFPWKDRTLPDMVCAHPSLVQHRNAILARYWPAFNEPANVGDSVSWVKV